jgi:adenine-specific DNA-methyltransferase
MIKYIGSKRTLLPVVTEAVAAVPDVSTVLDLFSGTSRVGHALKGAGYRVIANDHNAYAHALARCYVEADRERWAPEVERLVDEFNALPGHAGWFTHTFCEDARFFQPHNGARVDAIRDALAEMDLPEPLHSIMLVSLMEAADRVDSTCGLQMAYLKKWASRSFRDLELRVPNMQPAVGGPCEAHQLEAVDAAAQFPVDVAYLDPPYNQHSYLRNYHVWESLVLWDKPEVYGIARKRMDCKTRKSAFNSKPRFYDALRSVIDAIDARVLIVSFNNEGYIARDAMEELLARRGRVHVTSHDYKRYVGAQIGIHNPDGAKVGTVSHLRNKEFIYVVEMASPPRTAEPPAGLRPEV